MIQVDLVIATKPRQHEEQMVLFRGFVPS